MNPAKQALLDALTAEQHNGGGWATPPKHWNAGVSTAVFERRDDDVIRARRRREALADLDAMTEEETA